MMMKFETALREKYHDTHQQMYGLKEEENTMRIMRSNIHSILSNYSAHNNSRRDSTPKKESKP